MSYRVRPAHLGPESVAAFFRRPAPPGVRTAAAKEEEKQGAAAVAGVVAVAGVAGVAGGGAGGAGVAGGGAEAGAGAAGVVGVVGVRRPGQNSRGKGRGGGRRRSSTSRGSSSGDRSELESPKSRRRIVTLKSVLRTAEAKLEVKQGAATSGDRARIMSRC